jgi:hypothetical protein
MTASPGGSAAKLQTLRFGEAVAAERLLRIVKRTSGKLQPA